MSEYQTPQERMKNYEEERANKIATDTEIARSKSQNTGSVVPYINGMDNSKPREFKTGRSSIFSKKYSVHPMGGRKSRFGRKKRANKRTMKRRR